MKKKIIHGSILAIIIIIIGGWLLCNHLYNEKYDYYLIRYQQEYINRTMNAGTLRLIVSIDTERTAYHHLGDDISMEHTCNGQKVRSGDIVRAYEDMCFETVITEHDSIDDVGTGSCAVHVSKNGTGTNRTDITVEERGGRRYSDAYATWKITYSVEPDLSDMEEVSYWEVVFS